jgi:hypothetical protein
MLADRKNPKHQAPNPKQIPNTKSQTDITSFNFFERFSLGVLV